MLFRVRSVRRSIRQKLVGIIAIREISGPDQLGPVEWGETKPHLDCERHHSGFDRFSPPPAFPCVTMIRRQSQDRSLLWISPDAAPSSAVPPERLP